VAAWHARPDATPRGEIQQILDTTLDQAQPNERRRFEARRASVPEAPPGLNGQHVAIAVVRRDDSVLLVRRRDSEALTWQFPAGVVKPGSSAYDSIR
jgi:8-oxo-dGTP diphosphatase